MRRVFWLAVGLGAGATVAVLATRAVRRTSRRLTPAGLGRQVAGVASDLEDLLRQAAADFRSAAREKEAEIRAAIRE